MASGRAYPCYSDQPEWSATMRQDLSIPELLAFTKNRPLDFAPGTNWNYSHTG